MTDRDKPAISDAVRLLGHAVDWISDGHPNADALSAYIEGQLDDDKHEAVDRHLLWCRECADLVADRGLLSHTADVPEPLPMPIDAAWDDLQVRVARTDEPMPESRVEETEDPAQSEPLRRAAQLPPWLGLAAGLILIAGLAGWGRTYQHLESARTTNRSLLAPRFGAAITDVTLAGAERAGQREPTVLRFGEETDHAALVLTPDEPTTDGRFIGRVLRADGSIVVEDTELRPSRFGTFTLALVGGSLPAGHYLIEIEPIGLTRGPDRFPIEIIRADHPSME